MKNLILVVLLGLTSGCGEKSKEARYNTTGSLQGYGGCNHCGDTWNWKQGHSVMYSETSGAFPLCEECYQKLKPEIIWEYYIEHFKKRDSSRPRVSDKELGYLGSNISKEKKCMGWSVGYIREKYNYPKQ